jgi:hypothetical protein
MVLSAKVSLFPHLQDHFPLIDFQNSIQKEYEKECSATNARR